MKELTELEKKIKELGGKLIPVKKWDDNIADDINDEGVLVTKIVNSKVLTIRNESGCGPGSYAELAYAKFGKKQFQVCYKWVPLWRFHNYSELFVKHWRTMFPKKDFFATMLDDCDIEKDKDVKTLRKGGFEVASFEGF